MPDWVAQHRSSISFVVIIIGGLTMLVYGLLSDDPALVAVGGGAIGLPGIKVAAGPGA